jgi:hypothetical protein
LRRDTDDGLLQDVAEDAANDYVVVRDPDGLRV